MGVAGTIYGPDTPRPLTVFLRTQPRMDDSSNAVLIPTDDQETAIVKQIEDQTPQTQASQTLPSLTPPAELARAVPGGGLSPELRELLQTAKVLHESGLFGTRSVAEAAGKIWTGRQLGVSDLAALTGITRVKSSMNYHYMLYGTKINCHPTYSFVIAEHTDEVCRLEFYDGSKLRGVSSFTLQDAKRAGLLGGDNWRNYPKNMLYARAMANGVRFIFPDLIGAPLIEDDEVPDVPTE